MSYSVSSTGIRVGDKIKYVGNSEGHPFDRKMIDNIYTVTEIKRNNYSSGSWYYFRVSETNTPPNEWNVRKVEDECGKCVSRCRSKSGKCGLYSEV
jgi:hypothetical protein